MVKRGSRDGQVREGCDVQRFHEGLVFKAHRLLYHSALGSRVIKKKGGHAGARHVRLRGGGV